MNQNEFSMRVKERRNRGLKKDIFYDFLLLALPTFLLCCIFFLSLYSFILSFFAVYFILPMFYTVERRIHFRLTGIGKRDFTYKDGYTAFFRERKGGIFGAIGTFFFSFSLLLLSYVIFMGVFPSVVNAFTESQEPYRQLMELINDPYSNLSEVSNFLFNNLSYMYRPLSVFLSLCFFFPIFYFLFIAIPTNLVNHDLATIVLPDIDKNISASQARSLAKNGFGRFLKHSHIRYHFAYNWPYMVAFTLLYGTISYLMTLPTISNSSLIPLVALLTPTISVFFGMYLQYFVLLNDYALIEELAKTLPDALPEPMKDYISQAFNNPNYAHGEETALRGPFLPEKKRYENTKVEEQNDVDGEKEMKEPHSVVVDFSKKDEEK